MVLHAVIDTNVLVSALWNDASSPAKVIDWAVQRKVIVHYNAEILAEYARVLARPKLRFPLERVKTLLHNFVAVGVELNPPASVIHFEDKTDRKFYDVAVAADAFLITGNTAHYPPELFILAPNRFLEAYEICCRDNLSRRQFLELYARQEQ